MNDPHYHADEQGLLVKCYHSCRSVLATPAFWIGVTISFPIEHFLWERVPPFSWIGNMIGL